ncbi:hypothetical protein X975_20834, partial [Stegodyphus mimosarum]
MVYSFIIADYDCQVLYSSVFDFADRRCVKEDITVNIVQQIKKEFDFNSSVTSNIVDGSENLSIDLETKGILNVKVMEVQKPTVWHSYSGCLYILVCDSSDNRILAARTLVILIRTFRDLLPRISNGISEFVSKANIVSLIVNTFIPSGQLLFFHNQAIQQVTKDLQKAVR